MLSLAYAAYMQLVTAEESVIKKNRCDAAYII